MNTHLTFEKTRAGMKVYDGKKHIKTIPSRYESVFDKVTISRDKKRLLPMERFNFGWVYFLGILERTERYVYELVQGASPKSCYVVNVHDGSTRYEAELDNGRKIKIDADLYNAFAEKDDNPHFSNY